MAAMSSERVKILPEGRAIEDIFVRVLTSCGSFCERWAVQRMMSVDGEVTVNGVEGRIVDGKKLRNGTYDLKYGPREMRVFLEFIQDE